MRLFELRRVEDESGVSGTGTVAQGVIFDNGWCALTWLTEHTSVAFYTSIEEVIAIHGHGGKTRVVQIVNCDDRKRIDAWCVNYAQDIIEGVGDRSNFTITYLLKQRENFAELFREKTLDAGGEQKDEKPQEKKHDFKEFWDVTEKDRREIYEYAMKRSDEIIRCIATHATDVLHDFLSGRKQ